MWRTLVPLLLLTLVLGSMSVPLIQDSSPSPPASALASASAISYLVTNYNHTVGLIPEIPGGNTYWIYSDNLLGSIILSSHPENKTLIDIANNITKTMNRYTMNLADGVNQYMVFYSGIGAFNNSNNYNLAHVNGATIKTTLNNGTSPLNASSYGDIAFLKAIYYQYHGDNQNATKYFQLGYNMYDGKGIKDTVFTSGSPSEAGKYQTYKLALFILAAKISQKPIPDNATTILLSQQAANGGFNTGYVQNGASLVSVSSTNTETTSLATLALSYLVSPPQPQSWIWLYVLSGAVAGSAGLATGLTLRSRKLKNAHRGLLAAPQVGPA